MLSILQKEFEKRNKELEAKIKEYNESRTELTTIQNKISEQEKEIIFIQGSLKALDDVGSIVVKQEEDKSNTSEAIIEPADVVVER